LYVSTDSGVTWQLRDTLRNWHAVAVSADGNKFIAVASPGQVYTSPAEISSTLGVAGYLLGEQYSPVELQYVGNGRFILLSHEGTILPY
jgi:hypothetical protein